MFSCDLKKAIIKQLSSMMAKYVQKSVTN